MKTMKHKYNMETEKLILVRTLAEKLMRKYGLSSRWSFGFDSAKSRLGCCNHTKQRITLPKFYAENNSIGELTDTILHEIAHALTRGHHHDYVWKAKAIEIGCNGEICGKATVDELPKYIGKCPSCCYSQYAHRRIDCSCGRCSGRGYNEKYKLEYFLTDAPLTLTNNGELHGISQIYYLNRQLSEQSIYKYGILEGPHKTWHPNGKLERHCNYKNGKLDGELKAFRDDGQLWENSNFTNGLQDGESMWWNTDNVLSLQRYYKKGLLDGVCKLRNDKGQLTNRNFWKKGDHFGQQTIFKNC